MSLKIFVTLMVLAAAALVGCSVQREVSVSPVMNRQNSPVQYKLSDEFDVLEDEAAPAKAEEEENIEEGEFTVIG